MLRHGWKFVLLIVVAVFLFFWLIKAPLVSVYLSDKLGVPVTMRTISIWPKTTTIRHFRIANPSRYRKPSALEIGKTRIHYNWRNVIGNPAIIDLITLDQVELNIVIDSVSGSDNNWSAIGSSMPEVRHERGVMIKKMIVKDVIVNVSGRGATLLGVSGQKRFNQMEFDNINSKDGFPTKELIQQIFKGAGILKYLERFLNPTQVIKEVLSPFHIFGKNEPLRDLSRAQKD